MKANNFQKNHEVLVQQDNSIYPKKYCFSHDNIIFKR